MFYNCKGYVGSNHRIIYKTVIIQLLLPELERCNK